MSKTFTQAPKPKLLTPDAIAAFERGGAGQDTQTHIPTNVVVQKPAGKIPMRRLSIDIPDDLHYRFKNACARARRKMHEEVASFIERRTRELEGQ
jgi:hypothetical protein